MHSEVLPRRGHRAGGFVRTVKSFVAAGLNTAYPLFLILVLYQSWLTRGEGHITPESGLGYWLGIFGVVSLALLLVYPFRKRIPGMRSIGSTPFWFRAHMALGLLAPTLILIHCNFKPGSANSSMALYSMLIVAGSGLIGRYLYGRIYRNMLGGRIEASSFFDELSDRSDLRFSSAATGRLEDLMREAIAPRKSLWQALAKRSSVARKSRKLLRQVRKNESNRQQHNGGGGVSNWFIRKRRSASLDKWLRDYQRAIWRASSLAVSERLFALWHVLHLPLFILLILAMIVHVIAVHLY